MTCKVLSETELFECRQCGDCCRGYGGTFVTPEEIRNIAAFIGDAVQGFVEKYCKMSGTKPVLAQAPNGYCVFWTDGLCKIHPVKPRMCRQWPFIGSLRTDIQNWRIMAGSCPGMRTDISDALLEASLGPILSSDDRDL